MKIAGQLVTIIFWSPLVTSTGQGLTEYAPNIQPVYQGQAQRQPGQGQYQGEQNQGQQGQQQGQQYQGEQNQGEQNQGQQYQGEQNQGQQQGQQYQGKQNQGQQQGQQHQGQQQGQQYQGQQQGQQYQGQQHQGGQGIQNQQGHHTQQENHCESGKQSSALTLISKLSNTKDQIDTLTHSFSRLMSTLRNRPITGILEIPSTFMNSIHSAIRLGEDLGGAVSLARCTDPSVRKAIISSVRSLSDSKKSLFSSSSNFIKTFGEMLGIDGLMSTLERLVQNAVKDILVLLPSERHHSSSTSDDSFGAFSSYDTSTTDPFALFTDMSSADTNPSQYTTTATFKVTATKTGGDHATVTLSTSVTFVVDLLSANNEPTGADDATPEPASVESTWIPGSGLYTDTQGVFQHLSLSIIRHAHASIDPVVISLTGQPAGLTVTQQSKTEQSASHTAILVPVHTN